MKSYTGIVIALGCVLLLALTSCDPGHKKVRLRLKLDEGMTLKYKQVTNGISKSWQDDSLMRQRKSNNTMNISWEVRRIVDDSIAEINETREVKYFVTDEKDSVVYDTTRPEGDYIMYTQPNGKIVDFDFGSARSSVDLAYMQDYLEQGTPVYPTGEFGIGHEWTQSTRVVLPDGPITAVTRYRLKSFARERGYDCAVVEYDGNMVVPIQPFEYTFSEDSLDFYKQFSGVDRISSSGNLYFAYREGMVVLQKEKWVLNGDRLRNYFNKDTDTVVSRIYIEYDVDYSLIDRSVPE